MVPTSRDASHITVSTQSRRRSVKIAFYAGPMLVTIIGGHGQIARHLTRLLVARGDEVRAVIRNPDHRHDVESDGASAFTADIEDADSDLRSALTGAEAVVFAAGAGPGSGAARKLTVDRDGVSRTVEAATREGVRRLVVISAMGTDSPPTDDEVFSVYLRAKAEADRIALSSELDVTIVRPGRLTDEDPTGRVELARHVAGQVIPRSDVAAVVAEVLAAPSLAGPVFEVVSGTVEIAEAVAALR